MMMIEIKQIIILFSDGSKLTSDEDLAKRFSELTGRTASCMQKCDVSRVHSDCNFYINNKN